MPGASAVADGSGSEGSAWDASAESSERSEPAKRRGPDAAGSEDGADGISTISGSKRSVRSAAPEKDRPREGDERREGPAKDNLFGFKVLPSW